MKELYKMIYQRKSVRKYDPALSISAEEMEAIKNQLVNLTPLVPDIRIKTVILEREKTTAKFGEYCLLLYSEKKPHYLLNAGYLLEQMDLFLASRNIGVCWYGLAKTKEKQVDGLDYVIMLAFGKSKITDFRKDAFEFSRKSMDEVWKGAFDEEIKTAVRIAPSACNSQPWFFESENNMINVYRTKKIKTMIPARFLSYFNAIDMGIVLCFLEIALLHKNVAFERKLLPETQTKAILIGIAEYQI
ncbi:MAG: nitroreductase [Acholeplasmataceae bacterium]|nr:nitroreductase [Acholeplasmataceae bacterium]